MSVITVDRLKIYTQLPILKLLSFRGKIDQNQHGMCYFKFRLDFETKVDEIRLFFQESIIKVHELDKDQMVERPIFCGLIDDIKVEKFGGFSNIIVKAVTSSIQLDRKLKMRSFQNKKMTYCDVVEKVIEDYQNVQIIWCFNGNKAIDKPIIQYKETDWEFIIRLASHFNRGIIVDETRENIRLYIGIKENLVKEVIEDSVWEYGISSLYYENSCYEEKKLKENYLYYILKRNENRYVGDILNFFEKQLMICSKEICFEREELVFYYTIGTYELLYEKTKYNELFSGLQLEGEVKSVDKECVKVHLMIDENEEQELFPYPWAPVTGNIFYCMPEVNSKVLLQFLGSDERDAVVRSVIRTNADVCNGYSDVQNRIFETAKKKTLKLFPNEMTVCGSNKGNMPEIALKDKTGIYLNVHEKVDVEAAENIVIKAGKIKCNAPVSIIQCAVQSSMEIHQDFNLYSSGGVDSIKTNLNDIEVELSTGKKKSICTPNWQISYMALGAVPAFGSSIGEVTAIGMNAIAGVPVTGGGKVTIAMSDAVEGVPYSENKYADAFEAIKIDVMNGGYPLPKCIKRR